MTTAVSESDAQDARTRLIWVAIAVAVVATIPFLPALNADFVSWDDDRNFLRNSSYRGLGLSQLKWMWTTFHMGHYVPLTWMTLGLDFVLWGMDARGYHVTNVALHAGNAVAIFFVSRRLLSSALVQARDDANITLGAAFAAMFFAVHPLRVESVAWVTERRDVLSGLLYSLAVLFYLRAVERPPVTQRRYAAVFALCFAAMLSKATAMTLPAVLLLINVYPLRRLTSLSWSDGATRQIVKLVPLALLSAAAILMSLLALHPGPQLRLVDKFAVSAYSLGFYAWKTLVPLNLGPIYEMPLSVPITSPAYLASYAVMAGLVLMLSLQWRRWPGLSAGVVGFLVTVLPMLGIVQNGPQVAADRYTYHAAPAIALLVGAAFAILWRKQRVASAVSAAAVLATLIPLTWIQTGYWRNSASLWMQAVRVSPQSAIANDGLGTVWFRKDSIAKSLEYYERAAKANPYYADARANIGIALARLGRFDETAQHFQRALELKPDFDNAENNWGVVEAMQGHLMAAIGHFRLALSINPDNWEPELNWGNALVSGGNLDVALPHYERAARLNPASVDVEAHWGATLAQLGKLDEAIPHFQRAVALAPSDEKAQKLLERAMSERAAPPAPGKVRK